jgi:hypothetical protein
LKKEIYFTGGEASQFKNKNNFANLFSHEAYFGLMAEWRCWRHVMEKMQVIGGTLKLLARLASLQRHSKNFPSATF